MKCIIKNITILIIVAVAIAGVAGWIPQEWGGYATAGVVFVIGLVAGVLFLRGLFRNTYRNLGRLSHEQTQAILTDIRSGLGVITDEQPEVQTKVETNPTRTLDPMPRSALEGNGLKAHLTQICGAEPRETMPFAGYDKAPAKDPERFGVVQPELTAGSDANGIPVELPEKQPIKRNGW